MMVDVSALSWTRARTGLAVSAAAIGLAVAVAPASGALSASAPAPAVTASTVTASTAPEASASPTGNTPAGYQRIGGPAQGLTLAVPSSWVTVNLGAQTLREAIRKIGLHGANQQTLSQTLQALQKLHAVYAVDVNSVASSPGHFSTNVNGYCVDSGLSQSGSAGVPLVRQLAATELQRLGAQNLTQADVDIGGVPGVQTSYTLSTSAAGTLHAAQLEVLPKPGRACFVTLTASGSLPGAVLAELAPSVQYT
jgi:hypothetical protein